MSGFEWDEENIAHIARHGVTPAEAEEVFGRNYVEVTDGPVNGEERYRVYGITARGRFLTVPYTERNDKKRPITAWEMSRSEREEYAQKIIEGF